MEEGGGRGVKRDPERERGNSPYQVRRSDRLKKKRYKQREQKPRIMIIDKVLLKFSIL